MRARLLLAAGVALLIGGRAEATTVLTASGGACAPGQSCLSAARAFYQVTPASSFTGGLSIAGLAFDRSILGGREGVIFRVSFWVHGGTDLVGNFGRFMIDGMGGQEVQLAGQPFWYDPAWGDLFLKVEVSGEPGGTDLPPMPAFWANAPFDPWAVGFEREEAAAEPRFRIVEPGPAALPPIPEPQAWALMILGFGLAGAALRKRKLYNLGLRECGNLSFNRRGGGLQGPE